MRLRDVLDSSVPVEIDVNSFDGELTVPTNQATWALRHDLVGQTDLREYPV